ncbi:MAG: glutathione S-transferase family protein [Burkholderiales bacterium]
MLKVWGRANSVNVRKVLWCCDELGVAFERVDAGLQYGVVNTPEYRKLNPNGLVPTIEDDGFVLWESHAIVRYLSARYGAGKLWPADDRARADADRWMDWASGTFGTAFRPAFWGLVRTPAEQRDMKSINEAAKKCGELAGYVDAALAARRFVAGEQFTMGDIPLGCHLHLWLNLPIERPACANLSAWHKRLLERPAFDKWVNTKIS